MKRTSTARNVLRYRKLILAAGTLVLVAVLSSGSAATLGGSSPRLAQYAADVRQAQQALDKGERERAQMLLKQYLDPSSGGEVRGFEWRYLWQACQQNQDSAANPSERRGLVEKNTLSPLIFTPDSRVLISACADNTARQFDVNTLNEVTEMAGVSDPLHLCTDGHTLIASGYSGLQVWDLRAQVLVPIWYFPRGENWAFSVFSPEGKWGVVCHSGDQLQFIDVVQRQELANLSAHTGVIRALAFSSDHRTVASAGTDTNIRLWDFGSHTLLRTLTGHTNAVTCLAFSPDGQQLSSAGLDCILRVWTLSSTTESPRLKGRDKVVRALAYSPDGRTLASGGEDDCVMLWNPVLGVGLANLSTISGGRKGTARTVARLAFSPDGTLLSARLFDGTLLLWRATRELPTAPAIGH